MRIAMLRIDGYGLFSDRKLDISPGLQIVVGPNEQGKSTLRSFITDMLYGQRRSARQLLYDPSHELRRPWANPGRYGGRMVYHLDDGRIIEVVRSFDDSENSVSVVDCNAARDITDDFERLGNEEPVFALTHLGLTKDVFAGTATFSHVGVEEASDRNALGEIRDKLLSIADCGEETSSAEMALEWLANRTSFIGQPAASNRPLPAARAKLHRVNEELRAAIALRGELDAMEEQRRILLDEERALRRRRVKLADDCAILERVEGARVVEKAAVLEEQIEAATSRCFQLGSLREFPLDRLAELQREESAGAAARTQLERKQSERAQLVEQIETERRRSGIAPGGERQEVSEETEAELAELDSRIARLRGRVEETKLALDAASQRLQAAQADAAALPDFSRIAPDTVERVTQLAASFREAARARETQYSSLDAVRARYERASAAFDASERVFGDCEDFPALAKEYSSGARRMQDELEKHKTELERLDADAADYADRLPGFLSMALVVLGCLTGLLTFAFWTRNWAVLIPSALTAILLLWFLLNWAYIRAKAANVSREAAGIRAEIARLHDEEATIGQRIEAMMERGRCATLREIEALYDQHREIATETAALRAELDEQETRTKDAADYAAQLLERHRGAFAELGARLDSEEDLDAAAAQAIARFQEYRDAKRRTLENKELVERREHEAARLGAELEGCLKRERELSLEVRAKMRAAGYADEQRHDNALRALRSFRIRAAQLHEQSGRIAALEDNLAAVERQIAQDEADLAQCEAVLASCLRDAGVDSAEAWRAQAVLAQQYRQAWEERSGLERELESLTQGRDLEALRREVEADGPLPGGALPDGDTESLRQELEDAAAGIDHLQREEHALHVAITERAARVRSLNEIEEEQAFIESRVADLDAELRAAAYAMAQIEEVARDKHTRLAPKLASVASRFLCEITAGAYEELLIDRDLQISVRIPQTNRLDRHLEQRLSRGAVDQIYLALRLAMVHLLSENRETIPMLLDDPFANYDDERLERTMALLSRIAAEHQIILFTCREDVVRAGRRVDAAIVEL